jgi:hypothetical protein
LIGFCCCVVPAFIGAGLWASLFVQVAAIRATAPANEIADEMSRRFLILKVLIGRAPEIANPQARSANLSRTNQGIDRHNGSLTYHFYSAAALNIRALTAATGTAGRGGARTTWPPSIAMILDVCSHLFFQGDDDGKELAEAELRLAG